MLGITDRKGASASPRCVFRVGETLCGTDCKEIRRAATDGQEVDTLWKNG